MSTLQIDFKKLNLALQPHVMAGILQLKDDSDTNYSELERLIKSDQNLTGFVLKASNSPLYARGNEIRKLQHAIALLGFRVIRSLAAAAGSQQLFQSANYARFRKHVWQHSVASAVVATKLCEQLNLKDIREEAFVATLLHDIGKVVLNSHDRKKFIEVINKVEEGGVTFSAAESEIFGSNHMEVGAIAATEWKLPAIFSKVLGHHDGDLKKVISDLSPEDRRLFLISAAGNHIANATGYGHAAEAEEEALDFLMTELGFSQEAKLSFLNSVGSSIEEDEFYKFFILLI